MRLHLLQFRCARALQYPKFSQRQEIDRVWSEEEGFLLESSTVNGFNTKSGCTLKSAQNGQIVRTCWYIWIWRSAWVARWKFPRKKICWFRKKYGLLHISVFIFASGFLRRSSLERRWEPLQPSQATESHQLQWTHWTYSWRVCPDRAIACCVGIKRTRSQPCDCNCRSRRANADAGARS